MTPYVWRLCLISLAVLFVVQSGVGVLLRLLAGLLIRYFERLEPARAANAILVLRWLPAALGLFVAGCLCAPVYLRLEPLAGEEEIGFLCLVLAALAAASYAVPLARAAGSVLRSEVRLRKLVQAAEQRDGVYVIKDAEPPMALAGLWGARLVVSQEVLALLTAEQMDAAQRHERAHEAALDNWKRLLLEAAPVDLGGRALHAAWSRLSEWAADDRAADGDSARSVALASALVSVARLGCGAKLAGTSMLVSGGGVELKARIERLLEPAAAAHRFPLGTLVTGVCIAALGLVALTQQPAYAAVVHGILETLVD